jgi:hypothetical protein
LAAERLAFFQIGCAAGATRLCFFFFFFVVLLVVRRVGIALARLAFLSKNRPGGQIIFCGCEKRAPPRHCAKLTSRFSSFSHKIDKQKRGTVDTPAFMVIGIQDRNTRHLKAVTPCELNAHVVLGNTYNLFVGPTLRF